MSNIYSEPKAELKLGTEKETEFGFFNLGFWRKAYLIINLVFLAGMCMAVFTSAASLATGESGSNLIPIQIGILIYLIIPTIWLHFATSNRKITQLLILIFVNLILYLNPVSALIIYAIRRTSKREMGLI